MIITYTIDQMNFPTMDVAEDMELENLLALIVLENPRLNNVDSSLIFMFNDGVRTFFTPENMKKKLNEVGLTDNCLFYIGKQPDAAEARAAAAGPSSASGQGQSSQTQMISRLVKSIKVPTPRNKRSSDQLARALNADKDNGQFERYVRFLYQSMGDKIGELRYKDTYPLAFAQYKKEPDNYFGFHAAALLDRQEYIRKLTLASDPTNPEGQKAIEDLIRFESHKREYDRVMKEMPESFVRSHMLYIKVKVNGIDTVAFIDSGAQVTVVSRAQADKFGLSHKIDKSFATIIRGVGGEQASEGRIHSADLVLNGHAVQAPFTVLDRVDENILLGLDTLRRNQGIIDLTKNCLIFGEVEVPFLTEVEYADECRRLGMSINLPPDLLEPLKPEEVDDAKMAHLIEMGYTPEEASSALAKSHNDLATAAQIIDTERQQAAAESVREQSFSEKKDEPME